MPIRVVLRFLPSCVLVLLSAVACLPTRSASLSVALCSEDGRTHDAALVTIPLRELEGKMEGFSLPDLAIYAHGREPVPFRIEAGTGGGQDLVLVTRVAGDGSTRILVVCPGPRTGEMQPVQETLPRAKPDFGGVHR